MNHPLDREKLFYLSWYSAGDEIFPPDHLSAAEVTICQSRQLGCSKLLAMLTVLFILISLNSLKYWWTLLLNEIKQAPSVEVRRPANINQRFLGEHRLAVASPQLLPCIVSRRTNRKEWFPGQARPVSWVRWMDSSTESAATAQYVTW